MGVAASVETYLKTKGVNFTLLEHEYSEGSFNTARIAHIDETSLAKAVLVRDEDFHYTLCVLPSRNKILRHTLNQIFDRHMELVDEDELHEIFRDCAAGAVPALGEAYGLDVIWDDELMQAPMVFIEAGDHRHLICLEQSQFSTLMQDKLHDHFSTERVRLKKGGKSKRAKVSLTLEDLRIGGM
ncbi:aminoacyl-tRNA deacylase [Cellvibrio sp. ARAG 10.3]|uniref:aminoacyl-tRNA deacylase n=1 Tax=Cellvibrio sp. ARAG 10.3 TaxID=3451358 RepID=UPI003F46E048